MSTNVYPIFIPSNRNKTKTFEALGWEAYLVNDTNHLNAKMFLECPSFQDMPLQRKRQFIFEQAVAMGVKFFWTIDDDLRNIQEPDFTTNKTKTIPNNRLMDYIVDAEKCVDEERHGFLSVRSRTFWFGSEPLCERFISGTPILLWNVDAILKTGCRFDGVKSEEDCFVMASLIANGYYPVNYGKLLATMEFTTREPVDEHIMELYNKLPKTVVKMKKKNGEMKHHRRALSNGYYVTFAKSPDELFSEGNTLDEFF